MNTNAPDKSLSTHPSAVPHDGGDLVLIQQPMGHPLHHGQRLGAWQRAVLLYPCTRLLGRRQQAQPITLLAYAERKQMNEQSVTHYETDLAFF